MTGVTAFPGISSSPLNGSTSPQRAHAGRKGTPMQDSATRSHQRCRIMKLSWDSSLPWHPDRDSPGSARPLTDTPSTSLRFRSNYSGDRQIGSLASMSELEKATRAFDALKAAESQPADL